MRYTFDPYRAGGTHGGDREQLARDIAAFRGLSFEGAAERLGLSIAQALVDQRAPLEIMQAVARGAGPGSGDADHVSLPPA